MPQNYQMTNIIFHNKIVFRLKGFLKLMKPKIYENDTIDKCKNINSFDRHDYIAVLLLLYNQLQHKT